MRVQVMAWNPAMRRSTARMIPICDSRLRSRLANHISQSRIVLDVARRPRNRAQAFTKLLGRAVRPPNMIAERTRIAHRSQRFMRIVGMMRRPFGWTNRPALGRCDSPIESTCDALRLEAANSVRNCWMNRVTSAFGEELENLGAEGVWHVVSYNSVIRHNPLCRTSAMPARVERGFPMTASFLGVTA